MNAGALSLSRFSLRSRLLIGTVTLVAVGLVVADVAMYALLRSSLIERVDRQLEDAQYFAARSLIADAVRNGGQAPPVDEQPAPDRRRRRAPPTSAEITYAQLLSPTGATLAEQSYGFGAIPAPALPADPAGPANRRFFTTGAADGSGLRYRVLAERLTRGGTVVVALSLTETNATLRRLGFVEGAVTVVVLAAVAALALWLVRLGLRPLTQMEAAAGRIAAGDLSQRVEPADDGTEVGRLGSALNGMLDRIEGAFAERSASEAKLRRFVADASHELRTPLTSIRGYAELFRHGASGKPADLSKSMRRIEDESIRMSTLVDEMLLLARLDQDPGFEPSHPVDLGPIAIDAVNDARVRAPGRSIDVTMPGDDAEPIVIDGIEARMRQVFANLLTNALTHTPDDAAVHVRVARNGSSAVIEVADDGPGMSAADAEKAFDRFFRVDSSRARESGGVGLGLSIVSAIVSAHGGTVTLETAPGRGATFTVLLPLAR